MGAALSDTSFNDVANAERVDDVGQISRSPRRVTADGASANHFQLCDLRERAKDVILDAVCQKRILFIITEISEWKHGVVFFLNKRGISHLHSLPRPHDLGS